ncbi:MAG: hypothetical protein JWN88_3050 [Frankiales bacterium]|jgi:hypothetical protein|nr:hypothetical protein [Frankiales bacterium]
MTSDDPVTCASCGSRAPAQPLTWSTYAGPEGPELLCDRCTRENVRSIETQLGPEHG